MEGLIALPAKFFIPIMQETERYEEMKWSLDDAAWGQNLQWIRNQKDLAGEDSSNVSNS